MSQPKFRFAKRKSLADFTSENMPNQILCSCLKANTHLTDDDILDAFNEAYPICIQTLADTSLSNTRSADFARLTMHEPQSSLLRYCLVFYLLSFHEKAPELRRYLANLKTTLEERIPEVFNPIMRSAASMAPMLPNTVFFNPSECAAIEDQPALNDTKDYVRISSLINRAKKRPKAESKAVLKVIRAAIADDCSDWNTILNLEMEQIDEMPDDDRPRSGFYIAKGQIRNFVKILKAIYEIHIIVNEKGFIISNFEDFAYEVCSFFNSDLNTPPDSQISEARETSCYMDVFNKLYKAATTDSRQPQTANLFTEQT